MLRCPIGKGTCSHSLINAKNPKDSIFSHFCVHHRDGGFYHTKVEGSHNNFLCTTFPGPLPPSDVQSEDSFALMSTAESASASRRRQRLYPRLAGSGSNAAFPAPATSGTSLEELLFGKTGGTEQVETGVTAPGISGQNSEQTEPEGGRNDKETAENNPATPTITPPESISKSQDLIQTRPDSPA